MSIPTTFVQFASQWYDGMGSMLYAIASTGDLTRGLRRPQLRLDDGSWREYTDEEWEWTLYSTLASELRALKRSIQQRVTFDEEVRDAWWVLQDFYRFVDEHADALAEKYSIDI